MHFSDRSLRMRNNPSSESSFAKWKLRFFQKMNFRRSMVVGFFVRIDIFIINSELSWKFLLLKYIPSISVGIYLLQTVCLTRNNSPLNRKITAVVKRDYTTATDKFIDLQWVVSHSIKLRKQPLNFLCQNDFHTMDRNV